MLTKPKRPWKNLEQARKEVGVWRPSNTTDFPCLVCGGKGHYRDVKDSCRVEGYKGVATYQSMGQFHKCRSCGGSCIGSKAAFMEYYKKRMDEYKRELAIYQYKMDRFRELKKQLSKEDMDILEECLR